MRITRASGSGSDITSETIGLGAISAMIAHTVQASPALTHTKPSPSMQ